MSANKRSWDLKVERAEKHIEEIKAKMGGYAGKHPYRAVRVRQPKGKHDMWVYRLEMTEQPDPMIPVIIGECVHDLRSALDHLAVAMAPRNRKNSAAFPVEWTDPFADNERRKSFESKVKGIPPDAVTMIIAAQPYQREHPELETLGLISRLENADKHRGLIAIGSGVKDIRTVVTIAGTIAYQQPLPFAENGAEIAKFRLDTAPPESEVKVEPRGTATIAIEVAGVDGKFGMPGSYSPSVGGVM